MRYTRALGVAVALAALAVVAIGCSGGEDSGTAPEDKAPLTFIQFFDPECPFCQEMEPIVADLQDEYEPRIEEFTIVDVTTGEGKDMVEEFGVFLTPTFVLLDADGEELDRINGAATEESMIEFIDRGISDVTGGTSGGPREPIEGEGSEVE